MGASVRAPASGEREALGTDRLAVVLALLVAAWLGATIFFSAVVAPAAFAVLPSRALAGALVGRALPVLFLAGVLLGALAALLPARAAPPGARRSRRIAGALLALLCAAAQFGVGARIGQVRARIGPSLEALPPGHPLRLEFGRLHGLSVALLGAAALAAAVVLVACLRPRPGRRGAYASSGEPLPAPR